MIPFTIYRTPKGLPCKECPCCDPIQLDLTVTKRAPAEPDVGIFHAQIEDFKHEPPIELTGDETEAAFNWLYEHGFHEYEPDSD